MPIGINKVSRNSQIGIAIPDSEADQKLLHRWYLSEGSAPFIDQIGGADSTAVTGTKQVTGGWVGGAARNGDGTDDVIKTTSLASFGSDMDTDFAIAFSTSQVTSNGIFMGGLNDSDGSGLLLNTTGDLNTNDTTGVLSVGFRDNDSGGSQSSIKSSTNLNANSGPFRVVFNKRTNDPSNWEIWINQSDDGASVVDNTITFDTPTNFDFNFPLLAGYIDGLFKPIGSTIDDVCIYSDSLTDSEIQSYDNPWL